jgi:hypothetical protein
VIVTSAVAILIGGCRLRPAPVTLPASPAGPPQVAAAGAQPVADPQTLAFSAQDQRPAITPDLLPAGAPAIFGFVQWPKAITVAQVKVAWGRAGKSKRSVPAADVSLVAGSPAFLRLVLRPDAGKLTPGLYEVDVVGPDHRVTGTFMVAWGAPQILGQAAPPAVEVKVSDAKMALGVKEDGSPRGSVKTLTTGTEAIYFAFRYAQAEPGVGLTITWALNDEPIKAATREVTLRSSAGWAHAWMQAQAPLPAGTLHATVRLSGDETDLASAEVKLPEIPVGPSPR